MHMSTLLLELLDQLSWRTSILLYLCVTSSSKEVKLLLGLSDGVTQFLTEITIRKHLQYCGLVSTIVAASNAAR
jgi:hypothetical protein